MNEFYKTRDAVLGVEDVLNIQNSVHLYSSKHATLSEEEKHAEVEKYYRDLSLILADESRLEKFTSFRDYFLKRTESLYFAGFDFNDLPTLNL